jgi:ubiquitin C-terminal hydrolase
VQSSGLVNKLLKCCLFPELDVLASVHPEKGSTVSVDAIFEAHPRAVHAAQHSIACRDVCFELVFELMTHNRASWDAAHPLFMRLLDAGASIYPFKFRNSPLPSLRAPGALCGLCNGGATCYMNATFQQLYMQPTVRRLILSAPAVPEDEQEDSVFHQVQTMFAHLAAGVAPFFEPRGFWRAFKDYEGQSVNIREHQDAYEFFTRLQDSVDEHLRSHGHPRAIHAALGGTFAQVITVAGRPELRSQRDEDFYQVSLDVRGKKGLTESLESYVAVEMMNGENQWLCEELGKKVDAEKRTLIGSLPNTLMLHLKRFEWDYETYSRWKVKDRFEFPLELDMKPYTVEGCAASASASDGEGKAEKDASALHPDAYYKYELRGIVVHSGTAFAGHYYSYIKDRTASGGTTNTATWHQFDDTSVDPWDPVTLGEDCFGGKFRPDGSTQEYDRPNSAYMLIYERIEPVVEEEQVDGKERAAGQAKARIGLELSSSSSGDELMLPEGPGADEGLNLRQQESIARINLANIAMVHLFAPELFNFFSGLARELRLAAAGGTVKSRKIARGVGFTSPSSGVALGALFNSGVGGAGGGTVSTNNNNTGLGRMTSHHRPEEIDDILATATSLCCNYLYNVLARGPVVLINDLTARKGESLIASLNSACRTSKTVSCILLALAGSSSGGGQIPTAAGGDDGGTGEQQIVPEREGMAHALSSYHRTIREGARTMLGYAVKVVLTGYGNEVGIDLIRPVVDAFMEQLNAVKKRMIHPLTSSNAWDEILSFLDEILSEHECLAELAMPHLDTVLAIGRPLVDGFWSLSEDDKYDYDFGKSYLSLLATVLLRYDHTYLSAGDGTLPIDDGEDDEGGGGDNGNAAAAAAAQGLPLPTEVNPYSFTNPDGSPLPPLPKVAWDFFFQDETFLRRLLMPGCVTSPNAGRLIQWLWYNNYSRHNAIAKAFMDHIDDDLYGFDEFLAAELPQLVDILTLKDILTPERYKESLLGENENGTGGNAGASGTICTAINNNNDNSSNNQRWGLLEMTQTKGYIYRVTMIIRVVVLMYQANETVFYEVLDGNGNASGTAQDWARAASERIELMRHNLKMNPKQSARWLELSNECVDADSWFQLDDLSEQLLEIAGEYEYDDEEEEEEDS